MNETKVYGVTLKLKDKKKDLFWCALNEIRVDVRATTMVDACLKAQDFYSERLGAALEAVSAYEDKYYNGYEDEDEDDE